MATSGWEKAIEMGMGLVQNPNALRAIQNIPGATSEAITEAVRNFRRAADAGLLGPLLQQKVRYGGPPRPAGPIPTRPTEALQQNLPLKTRGGRPVTASAPRPTVRNRETLRINREAARAAEQADFQRAYSRLNPPAAPGQQSLFAAPEPAFRTTPRELPSSEAARALYAQDPGTYKAIQTLADRASAHYGVPVSFDELVGPRGTQILRELEYGPSPTAASNVAAERNIPVKILPNGTPVPDFSALQRGAEARRRAAGIIRDPADYGMPVSFDELVGPRGTQILRESEYGPLALTRTAGGGMAPPSATGRLANFEPGGPITVSPGGALGRPAPATASADNIIDLDYSVIRDLPQGARGAVPSATSDLSSAGGLTPRQILGLFGGAIGTGAAVGLGLNSLFPAGNEPGNGERSDAVAEAMRDFFRRSLSPEGAAAAGLREAPVMPSTSVAGQIGSGQAVIRQDDSESNYRQARQNAIAAALGKAGAPKAPGEYDKIGKYYAERERYAKQPDMRAELAAKAAALEGMPPRSLEWAAANPTLAYELLRRASARPELSQQTPQAQSVTIGAQMGDNPVNNPQGNAQAAASAAVDGTAGAADLEDATRPLIRPALNRVPLGGRYVPIGGPAAYPTVPFG